jgi:divalent metal cation (Fe/Co/Zn/Cd) transporter
MSRNLRAVPVKEQEPKEDKPPRRRRDDIANGIAGAAIWLMVLSFGGLIWTINGGFSVAGLEIIAQLFNEEGRIFWTAASTWTFTLPISVAGLPVTQPIIPWIGVISASMLQVVVIYARLRDIPLKPHVYVAAILMSLYDLGTTFFGAGTIVWIAAGGILVQGVVTVLITFSVEVTIGYLLKR